MQPQEELLEWKTNRLFKLIFQSRNRKYVQTTAFLYEIILFLTTLESVKPTHFFCKLPGAISIRCFTV